MRIYCLEFTVFDKECYCYCYFIASKPVFFKQWYEDCHLMVYEEI
jgi:hypothetical protein